MLKSITSIATVLFYIGCSSIDFKEDTIQNSGNSVNVQQAPSKNSKYLLVYNDTSSNINNGVSSNIGIPYRPIGNNNSSVIEEETFKEDIKEKIGNMLMVGFFGTTVSQEMCNDIRDYNLGGVILFDYNPIDKSKPKNIYSKAQLKKLTEQLRSCSKDGKLLIAVDQEGGKVQRLKSKYGFYGKFPKAGIVSRLSDDKVRYIYRQMAMELDEVGINFNLAPVVDLAINKNNVVIYKLGRSFGSSPQKVTHYASIFMDEMKNYGIITSAKHFPGHGSSLGDTHQGFVDVTNGWKEIELEPYRLLNYNRKLDTVMVAHVFNRNIDPEYPATLSKKTIDILRNDIGFNGVVITDDLQMGAIAKHYSLEETIKLAINAGNNILLFGNQLSPNRRVSIKFLVQEIRSLVSRGEVSIDLIEESNQKIMNLKRGVD